MGRLQTSSEQGLNLLNGDGTPSYNRHKCCLCSDDIFITLEMPFFLTNTSTAGLGKITIVLLLLHKSHGIIINTPCLRESKNEVHF